jgi:hypothetical protein
MDQEELRAFRDDLRRATGRGRDAAFPPLHTAAIAMQLDGNGKVHLLPQGSELDER